MGEMENVNLNQIDELTTQTAWVAEKFTQQRDEIKQMKYAIENLIKIIEEQKIEIGKQNEEMAKQYKTIEDQRGELEGLSTLQSAYTNRVCQSVHAKDDTDPRTMQYVSCIKRTAEQTERIKALKPLVKRLKIELDVMVPKACSPALNQNVL